MKKVVLVMALLLVLLLSGCVGNSKKGDYVSPIKEITVNPITVKPITVKPITVNPIVISP